MASISLHAPLRTMNHRLVKTLLPKRPRDGHKGTFGKVLLLCGAEGYTGAAILSAMGALRSGAGLVYLGVPRCVYPIVSSQLLEAVVFPLPDRDGAFSEDSLPEILPRLADCDACLIGCGIKNTPDTLRLVTGILTHSTCPTVLDADGINVLQSHIDVLRGAACPRILTPHPGEFRRLGGDLTRGRLHGILALQRALGGTVLLKGHRTLITDGTACYINRCGNPGMATGGSGDVLAGIIVGLLGQGLPPLQAASAGAWLHGTAGDLCAAELGEYSMLPSDLLQFLPRLLK